MAVEFEESNNDFKKVYALKSKELDRSVLPAFLIKTGLVRTDNQANIVMLGFSGTCLILMAFILSGSVFASPTPVAPVNPNNVKLIKQYISQGLRGQALFDKEAEARAQGLIK